MEEGKTGKRELRKRNEKIPLLNKFLVKALPLQLRCIYVTRSRQVVKTTQRRGKRENVGDSPH